MWSVGVIFYFLLTGDLPFVANQNLTIFDVLKTEGFNLDHPMLQESSKYTKKLLAKFLDKSPTTRITAKDALLSPYFSKTNKIHLASLRNNVLSMKQQYFANCFNTKVLIFCLNLLETIRL